MKAFRVPMSTMRAAAAKGMRSTCSACRSTRRRIAKASRTTQAAYLDRFALTAEQRRTVLQRDWLGMLKVGGNIYYTIKIAFCDGLTFQDVAGMMSGVPKEVYAQMMLAGGRSPEGNRYKDAAKKDD